jgi:hypothetical protein
MNCSIPVVRVIFFYNWNPRFVTLRSGRRPRYSYVCSNSRAAQSHGRREVLTPTFSTSSSNSSCSFHRRRAFSCPLSTDGHCRDDRHSWPFTCRNDDDRRIDPSESLLLAGMDDGIIQRTTNRTASCVPLVGRWPVAVLMLPYPTNQHNIVYNKEEEER